MAEDGLDDLTKRRLQSDLDSVDGLGAAIQSATAGRVTFGGAFFDELHRRGLPEDIEIRLLQWPMAALIHGAAGLLAAGLAPPKLFEAVTRFYDAMIVVDEDDFDVEGMFADLELNCDCGAMACPRSVHACSQIASALAASFAGLEALLPDFNVPELSTTNPTDEEKRIYNDACDFLYKQYRVSLRSKLLAIVELNLVVQLKAGIIQGLAAD